VVVTFRLIVLRS